MSFEHYYAGSQNPEDVEVLESVLKLYAGKPCRFLEIGVLNGQTARGVKQFCDENKIALEYWGIDINGPEFHGQPNPPFAGANFIKGDSAEVFHLVPEELDVVLSDGCHCINHVILETLHYGKKVVRGGFMLFHDTSPSIQQTMRDPHGPNIPEFHNSVEVAHGLMEFPNIHWRWHQASTDHVPVERRNWGGMIAYRKGRS